MIFATPKKGAYQRNPPGSDSKIKGPGGGMSFLTADYADFADGILAL